MSIVLNLMFTLSSSSLYVKAIFSHGLINRFFYFYCLQAENAMDQMDWIEKITGVIASLLNSQSPEQVGEEASMC